MESLIVERYMRLIEPLPFEIKLELISKLFESLKTSVGRPQVNKDALLDELSGSWKDVDDSIVEDIYRSRTTSGKEINLD